MQTSNQDEQEMNLQAIGNSLYPRIAALVADAAKVTGMILELEKSNLLEMMSSQTKLVEAVQMAMQSLRKHAAQELLECLVLSEDAWGKSEMNGVPWSIQDDGIETPGVPVERDISLVCRLRRPLAHGFLANVWVSHIEKGHEAERVLAGSLTAEQMRFTMILRQGMARIFVTLHDLPATSPMPVAEPNVSALPPTSPEETSAWADQGMEDDEELPAIEDLRAKLDERKRLKQQHKLGLLQQQQQQQSQIDLPTEWDFAHWIQQSSRSVSDFITMRMQENRKAIAVAVVEVLGVEMALHLLNRTEKVQANGGMYISHQDNQKRTIGGVFIALLREAHDFPEDLRIAASERIKNDAKEMRRRMKRTSGPNSPSYDRSKGPRRSSSALPSTPATHGSRNTSKSPLSHTPKPSMPIF